MTIIQRGSFLTKEAPTDRAAAEAMLAPLHEELGKIVSSIEINRKEIDQQFKDLTNHYSGVKATDELRADVQKHVAEYAELHKQLQVQQQALAQVQKEMDAPILRGGSDLRDSDIQAAIELQRRAFVYKGGDADDFKPDMENLVSAPHYRSAVRFLVKNVGLMPKPKAVSLLPDLERKAFEASSLDSAMFSPEMLGIELNCIVQCAELLDLYSSVSVSKSAFMYPQVLSYGDIGKYDCDAKCDAEYGPEGNIQYKNGQVYDWRGVFCLNRKILAEANYDLLSFMNQAVQRSYRINRNRALMVGDGVNEPEGWVTANCFTPMRTPGPSATNPGFNHVDFRYFIGGAPVEYGPVVAVMHQNVFAYLASLTTSVGEFVYGDGIMTWSPDDVRERIRISNCLPDPTKGQTLGSPGKPFVTGDFLLAAGNWGMAYYAVNKRGLWMEQWVGGSTAWCVQYVFGAEDGGFVGCCPSARTLNVGP